MPYLTSDGCNIHVDTAGDGPPVLLLHGFGCDLRQWEPQWPALADGQQAFRIDLRGHGRSGRSAGGYGHAAMARDVAHVMVQIGMNRRNPGFLVGHSLSADAALQAALAEPLAVRGVVVVTPAVWGHRWSAEWLDLWRAMQELARAGRVEAAFERFRADILFDGLRARPEAFAAVTAMQAACTGAHLVHGERDAGPTTLERLPACKVPVLVLAAERDREDFRQAAYAVADRTPGAELFEFPAAGHFPNLEIPAPFTVKLLEFLSRRL